MVEIILMDYLKDMLEIPVHMEEQQEKGKFIVLQKTAGGESDHIKTATFAIKSYGDSKYEAAILNEQLKGVMKSIALLPEISSAKLNSDYEFPDTEKKKYRYQAVYELVYYD